MRKLMIALILAALLLCNVQIALGSEYTMAGFDGQESNHDWTTNHFFERMQEKTGVSFQFNQYNDSAKWQDAKNAMFASGDLPDVLFKAGLTIEEQEKYSDAGLLIDLLPLLEEYAPNLWALFTENPEWLAAITLPNGKVAALPTINTLPPENAMWINQTWLDAINLDTPADFESLVSVLTSFKTRDPNRNGKNDEIPVSFLGPWDLKFLAHAFGLVANDYNVYVDENGEVRFMPLQDAFIDYLKALASLYAQGLLDEDGFTTADTLRSVTDSNATVTYGMFFGPNPFHLLPLELGAQYALLEPLSYGGGQIYRDIFGPITGGTFAITSACPNPGELLSWVDYLYTRDGAIQAMAGTEGTDFIWSDDGTWQYAFDLQAESSYVLYDLSVYDTGNMPWLFPVDFYASYGLENLRKTTEALIGLQSYIVNPFPYYYVLSSSQRDAIAPLQLSLGPYVDESISKFVIGELDINDPEDIIAFKDGLYERGMQEFIAFWQEIYDSQRIR